MSIQLPNDGPGKTVETNIPNGTDHRQVVTVGDKTTAANVLAIDASGRPTVNINGNVPVTALLKDSGGTELGTATNPIRTDPTSTTVQPVSLASVPSHAVTNAGTFAVQAAEADGANVTLGAKADAKSTATDITAVSAMSVLKQISASVQAPPSHAVTNAGTFAVQSTGQANSGVDIGDVTINNAAGASAVNIQDGGNSLTVDNGGTFAVQATLAAETTKVIGTVNIAAAQTIAVTNTGTFAVQNTPVVPTSGGCSTFHLVAAGATNVTNVKASAGQVYGWTVFNNANYPVYVKLHNTAATPTAGSGVVRTIGCQAGTSVSYANPAGLAFGTGIGISIVKDITDAGTTVVVASDCVLDLEWK